MLSGGGNKNAFHSYNYFDYACLIHIFMMYDIMKFMYFVTIMPIYLCFYFMHDFMVNFIFLWSSILKSNYIIKFS